MSLAVCRTTGTCRPREKCRSRLALWAVFLLALGIGCDAWKERLTPEGPRSAPLRIAVGADPGFLDPIRAHDPDVARVTVLLHEGLVVLGDSLAPGPGVAGSWVFENKDRLLRLHLDPRATFADGRRVTAWDAGHTLERLLDPLVTTPLAETLGRLEGASAFRSGESDSVAGIVVVDSLTLELRFRASPGPILAVLADPQAGVVPADLAPGREPPGLGPWVLDTRRPGRSLVLTPRPDYHRAPVLAPRLEIQVLPERWQRVAAFEDGRIDLLDLDPGSPAPPHRGAYPAAASPQWAIEIVALNCQKYPLNAGRVRQALNHALDLDTMLTHLRAGAAVRADGPLPPGMPGNSTDLEPYAFDRERAAWLLDAAGFQRGFHMEIWYEHDPDSARLLDGVRLSLRQIGIDVRPVGATAEELRRAIDRGAPDAVLCSLRPPYLDATAILAGCFHSGRFGPDGNLSRYESRTVDRLLERLESAVDPGKRAEIAAELESRLRREAPWIWLWHPSRVVATSPEVVGYHIPPDPRLERFDRVQRLVRAGRRPA